jgi:hypothetical protein
MGAFVYKDKNNSVNAKSKGISPPLDTLAQLPPKDKKLPSLVKRARSKWYTQQYLKELVHNKELKLHKQYSRAYHCAEVIIQDGDVLRARYCNSRSCNGCNRIRTAKFMNGYIVPLRELGQLYLTTLTIPNVTEAELPEAVERLIKTTQLSIRNVREKKGFIELSGIRKIEITYNSKTNTYHPHVHVLHNLEVGGLIIIEHLTRNPTAKIIAQDTRKMGANDLNEVFKYATKFLIKDDKIKNQLNVDSYALNVIMESLDKKRTFQTFGHIRTLKPIEQENETLELTAQITDPLLIEKLGRFHSTNWQWQKNDWYCVRTQRPLSEYKPPEKLYIHYKKRLT